MRNSDHFLEKIKTYKYVSFDIFDTLVFRNLGMPSDLFFFMEKELEMRGHKYNNFYHERVKAEKIAISQNTNSCEITLGDIYRCLNFNSEKEREFAQGLEIEMELKFCVANIEMIDVLKKAKQSGKTIIITSDMYLPKVAIEKILNNCDISYDYLYVSSEYGIRKSSGKLFRFILNDLGITKKDIIHIGDNRKSDYLVPRLIGIDSIRYQFVPSRFIESRPVKSDVLSHAIHAIKRNSTSHCDDYKAIGYNYFGSLLTGFTQWLVSDIKGKQINRILFFSRDGFVMQKAFNILYPEEKSDYVVISRRSITVPQLIDSKSWNDVINTLAYVKREELWKTLLHKIGLDDSHSIIKKLESKFGLNVTKEQLLHSEEYVNAFDEVKDMMWKNASIEEKEARQYLEKYFKGKVAIVDIGWYGTMQQNLESFFSGDKVEMNGYYIGLLAKDGYAREQRQGYIYDYKREATFEASLIYGFNGLIESFFSANHGSAKKYENGQPVLEEWESENWPIISKIQEGALQFCKDVKWLLDRYSMTIDSVEAYTCMQRLFVKPHKDEIKLLGKIVFFDTYYEPLIKFGRGLHYLMHPKDILKDLMASNWKIGFLKNLTGLWCADKIYLAIMKLK